MAKHRKRKSKKLITDNKLHSKEDREEFGDDLLIEILLRLPVISLLLFKSVSKRWLSLITDPSFTLRRSQIRNIDPPSGLFLRGRELYFVPLDIRIPSNKSRVHTTVFNFGNNKILQPCNGLFLCASSQWYHVYNPSTKVCKMLPQRHKLDLDQCCYVGGMRMAFDPTKSPHYKVIYAGHPSLNVAALSVGIQTYSSETGNWSVCGDRFPFKYFVSFEDGIYWNGGIHWLEKLLYCKLDIVDRPNLTIKSSPLNLNGKLFESRGCLLFVGMVDATFKQFNIYDRDDRHYRWSLKYRINLDDIMMVYPKTWKMHANWVSHSIPSIVLGEKEEDSFLVMELHGKLVQYNIATKTIIRLCHFSVNPSNSFPFIASFAGL